MKRHIKVAIIIPSLKYLGPEIVMENITNGLKNKIDFFYISLRKNTKNDLKRFSSFKVYELGMKRIPNVFLRNKLRRILRMEKPAIVHANCYWPVILSRNLNCKKIVTVHNNPNVDFIYEYGNFVGRVMSKMFIKSLKKYDKVVSISNYVDEIINSFNSTIIHNSVDDISCTKKNKLPAGFNEKKLNIYTVSVLAKIKNIKRMLLIIDLLRRRNIFIKLYIIGDGPMRDSIKNMIFEMGLEKEVELLGERDKNYIKFFSRHCDCFMSTSLNEGLGLSIIEALRDSKYVCTSDFETAYEIISSGVDGKICKKDLDFVEYIKFLLNKKKNYKSNVLYSDRNRNFYRANFSNNIMCKAYHDLYTDIIKKNVMYYIPFFDIGGIESLMTGFIKENIDKYNFSILVERSPNKKVLDDLKKINVKIIEIPDFKESNKFRYNKELKQVFRENKIDVFHSNDYSLRTMPLLFARHYKVQRRIVHVHSSSLEGTKRINLKRIIINFAVRGATNILYCSNDAKKFVKIKKGEVLYNGVDSFAFSYDVKKRNKIRRLYDFKKSDIVLIQIGRMVPVKNFDFTLELMKKLPSKYKLLLLGDGILKGELQKKVKKNKLRKRVIFTGNVTNVAEHMYAADVFVLPSHFEGLPITLLEALSSGLFCVVSTNITKELSDLKNLIYVDLILDNWKIAIEHMQTVSSRKSFSKYMSETVFNVDNFYKRLEKIYG